VRKGFDEQLSKWTTRLPFSSLRAELLLLVPLAPPPACGFSLYSTIEPRQHVSVATASLRWPTSHLTAQSSNLVESTQQQLQIVPPRSKWVE